MEICVVGGGYVGSVAATCFAEIGHNVLLVEKDPEKLKNYRLGHSSHYEPGLDELISKVVHEGRLRVSHSIAQGVSSCDVIFVTVGTPAGPDGSPNLIDVEAVAREIGQNLFQYRIIVEKSTVPVNTSESIRRAIIQANRRDAPVSVASNPEFMREGSAVRDFLYPDRIVIGVESERARKMLEQVYEPLTSGSYYTKQGEENATPRPLLITDVKSAELIKHASNAFLATKISFINAISAVCELVGADVTDVARGMGLDSRISPAFLQAGIGYGGSCLPKDLLAFYSTSKEMGYDFRLLAEVSRINEEQCARFIQKTKEVLSTLKGKHLGVLGLAYKPNTDDVRESPAIRIIRSMLDAGAHVRVYDPRAMANTRAILPEITYSSDPFEVAEGADGLLLLTAWEDFLDLDFGRVFAIMRTPIILDGCNFLDGESLGRLGFQCYSMGRKRNKESPKEAYTEQP